VEEKAPHETCFDQLVNILKVERQADKQTGRQENRKKDRKTE